MVEQQGCGSQMLLPSQKMKPSGLISDLVEQQGFKPWTSALQRQRSNQLSYCPNIVIIIAGNWEKCKENGV